MDSPHDPGPPIRIMNTTHLPTDCRYCCFCYYCCESVRCLLWESWWKRQYRIRVIPNRRCAWRSPSHHHSCCCCSQYVVGTRALVHHTKDVDRYTHTHTRVLLFGMVSGIHHRRTKGVLWTTRTLGASLLWRDDMRCTNHTLLRELDCHLVTSPGRHFCCLILRLYVNRLQERS